MKRIESSLEALIFRSRWLLAPFYLGLVVAILILLFKFGKELLHTLVTLPSASGGEMIIAVLSLVDIALVANLLLIIIFSGYENFVSKMDVDEHEDKPSWMGNVGFSDLKIKLIGSIVAISGIELLKAYLNVDSLDNRELGWMVGIHMTFVVSGLMFALMDRFSSKAH